jgi:hypothetical protein
VRILVATSTIMDARWANIVKGSGRGGQQQQRQQALGEEEDFAVHASVYGKVQIGPSVDSNDQGGKGRERCLLFAQAGLSS